MIGTSIAERRLAYRPPGRRLGPATGKAPVCDCRPVRGRAVPAWCLAPRRPLPVTPAIDRPASAQPELSRIDDLSNALNVVQGEVETGLLNRVHDRPGLPDGIADDVALQ